MFSVQGNLEKIMRLLFIMRPQALLKIRRDMRFMNFFCTNCRALKKLDPGSKLGATKVSTFHEDIPYGPHDDYYCSKAEATTPDRHKCIAVKHPEKWYKKL